MSQSVDILISPSPVQVAPGDVVEVAVTLTNNSNEVERYELSVTEIDPAWYQFDWADMLLYPEAPGNQGTSYVRISVPSDVQPGTFAPVLQIRKDNSANVVASQNFLLTVVGVVAAEVKTLEISPEVQQTSGKFGHFQLHLRNAQNLPTRVNLAARPNSPNLQLRLVPPVIDMPPSGQSVAMVEATPVRRNWIGLDRTYDFTVGSEQLPNQQVNGRLVQSAVLPWVRPLLIAPAFLIGALIVPFLLAGLLIFLLWPRLNTNAALLNAAGDCVLPNSTVSATLQSRDKFSDIILNQADGTSRRLASEETAELPGLFASLLSVSPDSKSLAYVVARNEAMDNAEIYVINIQNPQNKQRISTIPNGYWPSPPVWSKNSDQLSYAALNNNNQLELWVVALAGNDRKARVIQPQRSLQLFPELYYGEPGRGPVCWSQDSAHLLVGLPTSPKLLEVATKDGTVRETTNNVVAERVEKAGPILAAPAGDTECFVRPTSQNDPEWRDQVMKSRNDRVAEAGCGLTAAAMMLNYFKQPTTPGDLNTNCLKTDANPLDWQLIAQRCGNADVSGGQREDFSWRALNETLKAGQPAIVGLLGGPTGVHFLVVVGGTDSIAATYRVNDPWDGTSYKSLGYFLDKGYELRWLIQYAAGNAPSCPTRFDQKVPGGFRLITPEDGALYNRPIIIDYQADPTQVVSATLLSTTADGQSTRQLVQNSYQIDPEGVYNLTLQIASPDLATPAQLGVRFTIDRTPPVVEWVRPAGVFESGNGPLVTRRAVPLEFKASDNLSGVASIEYQIGNQASQFYTNDTNTKPISLSDPGDYSIVYWSTDGAGNISARQTLQFTILAAAANGGGDVNIRPTVTPTPVTTAAPADNGNGTGEGNGNPAAGAPAAGAPAAGAGTGTVLLGVFTAVPNALNFDATVNQLNIQLSNTATNTIVAWTLPLSGPAANYLKVAASGSVPAGGSIALPVQLANLNLTNAPINFTLSIFYNNGSANIPIVVTIAPQPAPQVAFTLPASGSTISAKPVEVKLQVTTSGLAKLNHAVITAKYAEQSGGTPTDHLLKDQPNPGNDWTINWDITGVPPQSAIELNGKICWSADDSNCLKIDPGATGLVMPKPGATIALNPDGPNLTGSVTLAATVSGIVPVDHIAYSYTYQLNGQAVTKNLPDAANAGNKYTVKWDTTGIPPGPVTLTAKVCWAADDTNLNNCTTPTTPLPTNLQVEAPIVAITSPIDPASLPITVSLSGTVNKLYGPNAAVFIDYKAIRVISGTQETVTNVKATMTAPTNGQTTWALPDLITTAWPTQAGITFTPRICWDGDPNGKLCYTGTAITSAIPPLAVAFVGTIPDFGPAANIQAAGTPTGRVASVKYILTYQAWDGTTKTKEYNVNTVAGNATLAFDSVTAGLKPDQTLTFAVAACSGVSGTGCSPASPTTLAPKVLPTTVTAAPNPPLSPLPATVPFSLTAGGRGAGKINLWSSYLKTPPTAGSVVTTTINPVGATAPGPLPLAQSVSYSWNTGTIPPQKNISVLYQLCWGPGDLETKENCLTPATTLFSNLFISVNVSAVFFNAGQEYLTATNNTGATLPIPINLGTPNVITLPVTVSTAGSNITGVTWRLEVNGTATGTPWTSKPPAGNQFSTDLNLNLPGLVGGGANLSNDTFVLVASPVWSAAGNGPLDYYNIDPTSLKRIPVKFVDLTVDKNSPTTANPGKFTTLAPAPAPASLTVADTTMITKISTFVFNPNPGNASNNFVKRFIFTVSIGASAPVTLTAGGSPPNCTGAPGAPVEATEANNWTIQWDHTRFCPANLDPLQPITLGWRPCNTIGADYSGCLPSTTLGTISSIANLRQAGVRFVNKTCPGAIPLIRAGDTYFQCSTYDFQLEATPALTTTNSVIRVYAYPTSSTTITNDRVLLKMRPNPPNPFVSSTANSSNWNISAYWPDDPTGTPAGTPNSVANFINKTGDQKVTLGLQYCITGDVTNPPASMDDPSCTEWTGKDMSSINSGWTAFTQGQQGVIATWQPYVFLPPAQPPNIANTFPACSNTPGLRSPDPFCTFIMVAPYNNRTLRANVLPLNAATPVTIANGGVSFSYSSPPGSSFTFIAASTTAPPGPLFIYDWVVSGLPFTIGPILNVQLKATVTYGIGGVTRTNDALVVTSGKYS